MARSQAHRAHLPLGEKLIVKLASSLLWVCSGDKDHFNFLKKFYFSESVGRNRKCPYLCPPKSPLPAYQTQQDLREGLCREPSYRRYSPSWLLPTGAHPFVCTPFRSEKINPSAFPLPVFPQFSTPLPPPHISSHLATKSIACEEKKK